MSVQFLAPIIKQITGYNSDEWEVFIHEWLSALKLRYVAVRRLGKAGDLGRDVVGFCDDDKFDGLWDNFQCKHYRCLLQPNELLIEVGKIVFYSYERKYRPPRSMYFVSPRGVSNSGIDLIGSPTNLKNAMKDRWDAISIGITEANPIPLTPELEGWIDGYNFASVSWYGIEDLVSDYRKTAHWAERFGGLLPPPPKGQVPKDIETSESTYVRHLLDAYEDRLGISLADHNALAGQPIYTADFRKQRERFFDAEAFVHTYRDQTTPGTVEDFAEQIHHAIDPIVASDHADGFQRLCETLKHAGSLTPASVLAQKAKPQVKQGVCHQLANQDLIRWRKS